MLPDLDALDMEALKALVIAQAQRTSGTAQIEHARDRTPEAGHRELPADDLRQEQREAHRAVDEIRKDVMAASKIHADDTPVPMLASGNGKTRTGRLWTYVRDDRRQVTQLRQRYGSRTRRTARENILAVI